MQNLCTKRNLFLLVILWNKLFLTTISYIHESSTISFILNNFRYTRSYICKFSDHVSFKREKDPMEYFHVAETRELKLDLTQV